MKRNIVSYCKALFLWIGIVLVSGACGSTKGLLKQNYYYSPIGAIAAGPDGPAKKISIRPYCCPSTAIEIRSERDISDNDQQWVNIPLSVPGGTIKSVTVCYSIKTSEPGKTFISQVRLTKMTIPDSAAILHDDDTDLVFAASDCYTINPDTVADGALTLALRITMKRSDAIHIGGIALEVQQKGRSSNSSPFSIKKLIGYIIEAKIKKGL